MSRSHPSTNPSNDPNDPFARLLGADERRVPRAEFRAALRQHMLTFAPTPGLPIDAPLLGRVIVRPVHVLVVALLGVAAVAGGTVLRPADRAGQTAPPLSAQPAAPPSDSTTAQRSGDPEPILSAPVAAPAFARPLPAGAERRATVAARSVADRPERGPMARSSDAEPGDALTNPDSLRPAVAAGAGSGAARRTVPAAPTEAAEVPQPAAPPVAPPTDRDRDRDRPAAAPSATATALDPAGGIGSTSPPLLPPEPVAPTPAPAAAMPTVPVAPSPTAPTPGP